MIFGLTLLHSDHVNFILWIKSMEINSTTNSGFRL